MSSEFNKEIVRRYLTELFVEWNYDIINEIIHEDYQFGEISRDRFTDNLERPLAVGSGKEILISRLDVWRNAFPDLKIKILMQVAEDDIVIAIINATGTQQGEFMGTSSSNKKFNMLGTQIFRFKESKIISVDLLEDRFGIYLQLGRFQLDMDQNDVIKQYLKDIDQQVKSLQQID
ncbi:MAG: ester cyclase [Candidatus Heimdallarchaeota archaeon]|nr:ester cyclase [Candidatus Heimdallarchaeota archaeon]